jgi:hypothetical protein
MSGPNFRIVPGRVFAENPEAHWSEAQLDRLEAVHAALGRLVTGIGAEVTHVSGWALLYNRSSDGAEVSIESLFEEHMLDSAGGGQQMVYQFADDWRVEAPLPGGKTAVAELLAVLGGNPRVVASSLFMQLGGARYAGQPLPYRNNR